jgi:hypothetical protein
MNHNLITLSTFAATTLLVISVVSIVYDWLFRYRLAVRQRIRELDGDRGREDGRALFKDLKNVPGLESSENRGLVQRLENVFLSRRAGAGVHRLVRRHRLGGRGRRHLARSLVGGRPALDPDCDSRRASDRHSLDQQDRAVRSLIEK